MQAISALGILIFLGIAWGLSERRNLFPVRTVLWGLGLQFGFAVFILKTRPGMGLFEHFRHLAERFIDLSLEGARLIFGPLGNSELMGTTFGPTNSSVLVIIVPATIIVVSAMSALLYHWRILPRVVEAMAWVMQKAMKTSGSESLAAAANIFMGQTEAPLLIRPYLKAMTRSELLSMMTCGMATVAGGVMAVYIAFGAAIGNPEMAGDLLTASVISAPGALLVAKILLPETELSPTAAGARAEAGPPATNSLDALCRGASDGMKLSLNVMAMLIAFVAVIAMANALLGWIQSPWNPESPWTFQTLMGWLNVPFAWLMGVPAEDCVRVGSYLGERIVLNEFLGYLHLTAEADQLTPRSFRLATYALCGFANFGSVAIQIGGIGAMIPERRADLARLGLKSMMGGLLTCYLTAAMVGLIT